MQNHSNSEGRQPPIIAEPPRTECACAACVRCCKEQPGPLVPGDYEKIRDYLQLDDAAAQALFRSSDGALVQHANKVQTRQRTIVPLYDRRLKRCTFLDDNDRCRIHAVKPAGCAVFDTHMDTGMAHARSYWMLMQQADPAYQEFRKELKVSDHYKPKGF